LFFFLTLSALHILCALHILSHLLTFLCMSWLNLFIASLHSPLKTCLGLGSYRFFSHFGFLSFLFSLGISKLLFSFPCLRLSWSILILMISIICACHRRLWCILDWTFLLLINLIFLAYFIKGKLLGKNFICFNLNFVLLVLIKSKFWLIGLLRTKIWSWQVRIIRNNYLIIS